MSTPLPNNDIKLPKVDVKQNQNKGASELQEKKDNNLPSVKGSVDEKQSNISKPVSRTVSQVGKLNKNVTPIKKQTDFFEKKFYPICDYERQEKVLNQYYKKTYAAKAERTRNKAHEMVISSSEYTTGQGLLKSAFRSIYDIDQPQRGEIEFSEKDHQNRKDGIFLKSVDLNDARGTTTQSINATTTSEIGDQATGRAVLKDLTAIADNELVETTAIKKYAQRTTLFRTIINNSQNKYLIYRNQSLMESTQKLSQSNSIWSPLAKAFDKLDDKSARSQYHPKKLNKLPRWNNQGELISARHLNPDMYKHLMNQSEDSKISNLYLPSTQREFKYKMKYDRNKQVTQSDIQQIGMDTNRTFDDPSLHNVNMRIFDAPELSMLPSQIEMQILNNRLENASPIFQQNLTGTRQPIVRTQIVLSRIDSSSPQNLESDTASEKNKIQNLKRITNQVSSVNQLSGPHILKKKYVPKQRQSFSLCQTKYQDAVKLRNPLKNDENKGSNLKDLVTIKKMYKAKRFPIPDCLLHKPSNFDLCIDSILHEAWNSENDQGSQDLSNEAPYNSMESVENIDVYSEGQAYHRQLDLVEFNKQLEQMTSLEMAVNELRFKDKMAKVKLNQDVQDLQGFDLELLKIYPNQFTEGDVPNFLLKHKTEDAFGSLFTRNLKPRASTQNERYASLLIIQKQLAHEFQVKALLPNEYHIQAAYEYFCREFKCNPLSILKFIQGNSLNFENYVLDIRQIKAIVCTIPLISGLKQIKFCRNNLNDIQTTLIFLAVFMHPTIDCISIEKNTIGRSACNTLYNLQMQFPSKLKEISFQQALGMNGNFEAVFAEMANPKYIEKDTQKRPGKTLRVLNLKETTLSVNACMILHNLLTYTNNLKSLNVQQCHMRGQGIRYIIDGLNKNQGLEFINFSHNSLASQIFEYSIKIAKIISRHAQIMHIDATNTGLTKSEVVFIAMSLPMSKSIQAIHLSANGLDNTDRVYMRSLIDAKVQEHFKNFSDKYAQSSSNIYKSKSSSRRTLAQASSRRLDLLQTKNVQEYMQEDLKKFFQVYSQLEQERFSLNQEVHDIFTQLDVVQLFREIRKQENQKEKLNKYGTVSKNIQDTQNTLQSIVNLIEKRMDLFESQKKETEQFMNTYINFSQDDNTNFIDKIGINTKAMINKKQEEVEERQDNLWILSNQLKIERIKQRVLAQATQSIKATSSAELSMIFLSISKIAYDVLQENPMTGHNTELILSRQLGFPEIEDSENWRDCSQCWICEEWDKTDIEYKQTDLSHVKQNIKYLYELDQVLEKVLDPKNQEMLQYVNFNDAFFQEINQSDSNINSARKIQIQQKQYEIKPQTNLTNNQINSSQINLSEEQLKQLEKEVNSNKIKPKSMTEQAVRKMLPENYKKEREIEQIQENILSSSSSEDEFKTGFTFQQKKKLKQKIRISLDPKNPQKLKKRVYKEQIPEEQDKFRVKKNGDIIIQKVDGRRIKVTKQWVFYQGQKILVDKETILQKGEEETVSSQYSDDQFDIDDQVKKQFIDREIKQPNEKVQADNQDLHLCASFNDWVPVKINKLPNQFKDLKFTSFLPPGRHYFFFCVQDQNITLSSNYPVARFGSSSVFLNEIKVCRRTNPVRRVSAKKRQQAEEKLEFRKERSVFKTFQEDEPDFMARVLKEDLSGDRVQRLTKGTEDTDEKTLVQIAIETTFLKIKNMYAFYACNSPYYPRISAQDVSALTYKAKLFDRNLNITSLDRLIQGIMQQRENKGQRGITRGEFIELLVRISSTKYREPKIISSLAECAEKLINQDIGILVPVLEGFKFRIKYVYTIEVNSIFQKNEKVLRELFFFASQLTCTSENQPQSQMAQYENNQEQIALANQKMDGDSPQSRDGNSTVEETSSIMKRYYASMPQIREFCLKCRINLKNRKINQFFLESLQTRIETSAETTTITSPSSCMRYVEFLIFIARISFELFINTKQENEELHTKIETILEQCLKAFDLKLQWSISFGQLN